MNDPAEKKRLLEENIKKQGKLAVAFSGGIDSAFLLKTAHDILGDDVIAVTVKACMIPERELRETREFCGSEGITQVIAEFDALIIKEFRENTPDRCYHCKKALFECISSAAAEKGFNTVCEGSNADDVSDYRPGLRALEESGVLSPLKEAGLKKDDIRLLAKEAGISIWNKPSLACLATRFPYGDIIDEEGLSRADRAEQKLLDMGFSRVRVRIHGDLARIETDPSEMKRLLEQPVRDEINRYFKELGFSYTAMDLKGYRTGSMNEGLDKAGKA
ncbi:MAG: ATP-dependent sacrificial sulfur transferase LarE [Lachnospiraceae bacterium]|nr:ATP-dependent sacrificial sulfur transferase LarE [Lachnospiraceae bacterium]